MTTESKLIEVAIVDDHKIVSQGIEMIINSSGIANVIDREYSIKGCVEMLQRCSPDVLLLDLSLEDGNSLDHIGKIIESHPDIKILLLTYMCETAVIKRAFNSGAKGYVLKSSTADEIMDGIRSVYRNETFMCNKTHEQFSKKDKIYETLTPRERDILKLIVEGKTMKEIADVLNLSFETVRSYCKYIRLKMNVNNQASLVKTAIEHGLV